MAYCPQSTNRSGPLRQKNDVEIIDAHFNAYPRRPIPREYPWFHKILTAQRQLSIDAWSTHMAPVGIRRGLLANSTGYFVGLLRQVFGPDFRNDPSYWNRRSLHEVAFRSAHMDERVLGIIALAYFRQGAALAEFVSAVRAYPGVRGLRWIMQFEPNATAWEDPCLRAGFATAVDGGYRIELPINVHHGERLAEAISSLPDGWVSINNLGYLDLSCWREQTKVIQAIARTGTLLKLIPCFQYLMAKPRCLARTNILRRIGVSAPNRTAWKTRDYLDFTQFLIDTFGPDRLMFCTDWPLCLAFVEPQELLDLTHEALSPLTGEEQRKIWGGNVLEKYA